MAATANLRLNWLDHFDSSWVNEDIEAIVTRDGVLGLYKKLLTNREAAAVPHQAFHELKGPHLPDYERGTPTVEEQEQFLNDLLASQLSLARGSCIDSPFYSCLRRRLVILQRIFCAISGKFHKGTDSRNSAKVPNSHSALDSQQHASQLKCGTDALIEMGVKTGLSLFFALFRQSWQMGQGGLCNDVLNTGLEVISSLPPLSLSHDSKLPELGLESLKQVSNFLKVTSVPNSGADEKGRLLAHQLLLKIQLQRGSLQGMLEWIEVALNAACFSANSEGSSSTQGSISVKCIKEVIMQMRKHAVSKECFKNHFTVFQFIG